MTTLDREQINKVIDMLEESRHNIDDIKTQLKALEIQLGEQKLAFIKCKDWLKVNLFEEV